MSQQSITRLPAWHALEEHQRLLEKMHMRELFNEDPARGEKFSLQFDNLLLDYSKNRIIDETLELLVSLAQKTGVERLRAHAGLRSSKAPYSASGRPKSSAFGFGVAAPGNG